jgi:glutamate-ammonia-ligase adenylyltransferase
MSIELDIAKQYSQFVQTRLNAHPDWGKLILDRCHQEVHQDVIETIFEENLGNYFLALDETDFLAKIRISRQKLMLLLALRDLSGKAALEEVMQAVTSLAEKALFLITEYYSQQLFPNFGRPYDQFHQEMKMWVIGMGKLGGKELNVSSDIDLIFLYDTDGQTQGGLKSISHHEWFTILGKKVIKGLTELTAEGFVFRVDMRLRPNGDSGPLVCSLKMLEEYFLVQGREWERYAWIKARLVYPLSQDDGSGLCAALTRLVKPFVYRKYLDYGIIDAVRNLHQQIRYEANLRATQFPDRAADIKLGTGGIREIEFLAQMYQLIRGGQEQSLRIRSTVQTLKVIKSLRFLPEKDIHRLLDAYYFFRQLEHRLQWWNDAQIHYLPIDQPSLLRLAYSMNFESTELFLKTLKNHQTDVAKLFSEAFTLNNQPSQGAIVDEHFFGFFELYPEFKIRYERLLKSPRYLLTNDVAKQNLNIILLRVAEYQPSVSAHVLLQFIDLIEVILRRAVYLSLLREYPKVLERVFVLLKESTWGTSYLIKHPHVLDELIQPEHVLSPEHDGSTYWLEWQLQLKRKLAAIQLEDSSQEQLWNALRDSHHAEIFQTLLADLGIGRENSLMVEDVSDRLSTMADIVIEETLHQIWAPIAKKHNLPMNIQDSGFGVIAYGKLGGKELGYGSDLDLVFVYDDLHPAFREEWVEHFLVLVRRLIMWFTTATSSGTLFDIDTRLRPNGVSGLMVTSLTSFSQYQMLQGSNTAWLWEHQALTRARFCAGSLTAGSRFNEIRSEVLMMLRDPIYLRTQIQNMRQKIHEGHPNRTDLFDLKHDTGGMVDIEFMVQLIVLQHARECPELIQNLGNITLLKKAAQYSIIQQQEADDVSKAYRLFRKKQHQLRLDGQTVARVSNLDSNEPFLEARERVQQLWRQLMLNAH